MDICKLTKEEKELIRDAVKIAISPEVVRKVNDRFWQMEDIMTEISNELVAGTVVFDENSDQ